MIQLRKKINYSFLFYQLYNVAASKKAKMSWLTNQCIHLLPSILIYEYLKNRDIWKLAGQ